MKDEGQNFLVFFFSNVPSACRLLDMGVNDKEFGGCESHGCEDDSHPANCEFVTSPCSEHPSSRIYLLFSDSF